MNGRIIFTCHDCGETVDMPDKGLGRASVAAWKTNHQGHNVKEGR